MSNSWQEVYSELTDFIAEHSEIEIGVSRVCLPDSVRPEFYRLFNDVRKAFVEEKFSNLLNEATPLSQNYLKAEQEVTELLRLDDISMEASLHRFLHDPIDQLIRGLFNPLFDLLKGRINAEKYEEGAARNIEASFRPLYQLGYEKWMALSLVKLLKADKSFQVILPQMNSEEALKHCSDPSGVEVLPPQESKSISFDQELILTVPDFIVHSAKINRYVSARSELRPAMLRAANASEQRKWYPLDSVVALGPGLTLVYMADSPEEVSLVADKERICRPELIVECRGQEGWYEKEDLEKVRPHHDSLKPILGSYIVSLEPVPNQEPEKQEVGIHILTAGFDQSKLEPIVSVLMGQEDKGL